VKKLLEIYFGVYDILKVCNYALPSMLDCRICGLGLADKIIGLSKKALVADYGF
jgi:hypothetical protein